MQRGIELPEGHECFGPNVCDGRCATKQCKPKRKRTGLSRAEKDRIYRDLGLTKVRGANGGIYYE